MKLAIAALVAAAFALPAYAADPQEMLKSKGCLGCHDVDKKKVGPAYKDVAKKYAGDPGASAKIVGELKGGKDKGHPVAVKASDDELKQLADYVLSLK
jgi:cytochrome c